MEAMGIRLGAFVVAACLLASLVIPRSVSAAPTITGEQINQSSIPKYEKFEVTFQIQNTVANTFYPFSPTTPPGIPANSGITVNGVFTDPQGNVFTQPGFYYQEFQDQIKTNKEWFYPTTNFVWKIRFAPHKTGNWQYKIMVQDASGTVQTTNKPFSVSASSNHGFVKVSPDPRYFEFDDGAYFPGLGFNLNAGNFDIQDPVLGNQYEFDGMGANNVQLSRFWLTQKFIYGAAWSPWRSVNSLHQSQEPNPRISYPNDPSFKNAYPSLTMPPAAVGSDVYWWLNADQTGAGNPFNYTPCLVTGGGWNLARIAAKKNTDYRVRVRYRTLDMVGAFQVLHWSQTNPNQNSCTTPGGTIIASSAPGSTWTNSPDSQNPGWTIVSGTFNSGDRDFFNPFYISVAGATKGHVFVDHVWVEEVLGGGNFGENVIYKPSAAQHYYVNQRNAYAFDKALAYAEDKGITFKPVILEKNDILWRYFEFNGQLSAIHYSQNADLFYGNGRETSGKTKTRFLHEAWWRYLQARWGYSTSIHSWELLNEANSGPADSPHWIMVDVLGKYMNCEVFGVPAGNNCTYDHPNGHMVTTSFHSEGYPYLLWNNKDGNYPDVDYADQHMYARDDGVGGVDPGFYDEADFTYLLSTKRSAVLPDGTPNSQGAPMPFVRGEIAWDGSADALFMTNASDGLWLHNSIWGGINYGGMLEQYWIDAPGRYHIYKEGAWDHRNEFGNYYNFISSIPLNKGGYVDSAASMSNTSLRAWGQKNTSVNRAHIWIQNTRHVWCAVVVQSVPCPEAKWSSLSVVQKRLSGTVTLTGFTPNTSLPVQVWQFDENTNLTVTPTSQMTTTSTGSLVLNLDLWPASVVDAGVKIGNYATGPTPTPVPVTIKELLQNWLTSSFDQNGDGKVNSLDFAALLP